MKMTLWVENGTAAKLREIALFHGYVAKRGRDIGGGSISAFVRAIADGDMRVARVVKTDVVPGESVVVP